MAIPKKIAFRGSNLNGCIDFSAHRNVSGDKKKVGALGDVVRVKNTDRTGSVTMSFGLKSQGQEEMLKINALEIGMTGQLEVDVDAGGFATPAWISPEKSRPLDGVWVLEAATLPDE